ncbi:unnamed protein product, partial [Mesorhabditis belari]|uniref:Uncharacterized protein n=1 Tax=Mesorhabditis belari TaxID=2138241 RepID=A0AAF3EE71_9BILA
MGWDVGMSKGRLMMRAFRLQMRGSQRFVFFCLGITAIFGLVMVLTPKSDEQVEMLTKYLEKLTKTNGLELDEDHHVHDDIHIQQIDLSGRIKRTPYPKRQNFSECPKKFGKVTVMVAYVKSSMMTHYHVAQRSLECYLKGTNYELVMVDLDNDNLTQTHCKHHKQLFFKKHCAVSVYLKQTDWMLILDADTGIVNPNHCIEEWIDDRVDLLFYERFFNWEIASGNYLARNTDFAYKFIKKWADWEFVQPQNWNGADNGVLQIHILQTVIPDAMQDIKNCDTIWHQGKGYETYMAYVTCCKVALGATRLWPGKIRLYRRAHGWVRDGYITSDRWCENDFMIHGWKATQVDQGGWESPFEHIQDPSICDASPKGWPWREKKKATVEQIRQELSRFENRTGKSYPKVARVHAWLELPDVGECYPDCDLST